MSAPLLLRMPSGSSAIVAKSAGLRGTRSTISRTAASGRIQLRGRSAAIARRSRHAASAARQPLARRVEIAQSLDAAPGLVGIDRVGSGRVELGHFLLEPAPASELVQPLSQSLAQRRKVAHVIERVRELRVGQRAARPVGARLGLVQARAKQLPDQVAVADLGRQADQRGRHLGVEQPDDRAGRRGEHFQVLARGMQYS